MRLAVVLLLAWGGVADVMAARILAVFPMPAKSHHILFRSVVRTLATAGHEVVYYSPLPAADDVANLTTVQLSSIDPIEKTMTKEMLELIVNMSPVGSTTLLWQKSHKFMGNLHRDKPFLELINSNQKFDLVLLEAFFAQEQLFALGHRFKAPVINLQPFGAFSLVNRAHGNSLSLAFIPDFAFPCSDRMTFFQRALSSYSILSSLFQYYMFHIPEQDRYMRKLFSDPSMPPLLEVMQKHLALTFSNSHPYVHYAQPYTPNIQPIGGIHLAKERSPLPEEMKQFLDESTKGVIYFSVGSIVPDHLLADEYFDNFISAFRRLPQRVLWKTNRDLKNLPNNVMTSKWVPQQDVLAHPAVKVFMTHGGLFSQHEVIHAGVPVVCTPYFGDQPMNARFYEEKEIGVVLPFSTLSEETIFSALTTVLGNPKYKENMVRMSRIFQDRPVSPAAALLYWVDYVVRHRGAPHLTPASAAMPFYQLYLLDVIGAVVSVLVIVSGTAYLVVKQIWKTFFANSQNAGPAKSKKDN